MASDETELEMAERHVREGQAHVDRQREIVSRLRGEGLPVREAQALLDTFEDSLRQHLEHLDRIRGRRR